MTTPLFPNGPHDAQAAAAGTPKTALDFTAAEKTLTPMGKSWLQEWLPTPEAEAYQVDWLKLHAEGHLTVQGQQVSAEWLKTPASARRLLPEILQYLANPPATALALVESLRWPKANTVVECQDGTRMRILSDIGYRCHCYPPTAGTAGGEAPEEGVAVEVPELWSVYFNGMYNAFIPVGLVQLFIREHGGEKPAAN